MADNVGCASISDAGRRAARNPAARATKGFPKIRLKNSSETYLCEPGQTLLIAVNSAAAKIPVGCRGGGCGVCRVRILRGQAEFGRMSAAHLTPAMRQAGWTLACKTFPTTDLIISLEGQTHA